MEIKMLKELEKIAKRNKNEKCIFKEYDSEECSEEPLIKSHSISKNILKYTGKELVSLEVIGENGVVKETKIRDVTNNFGIFNKYICRKHDNKIFKKIENKREKNYGTEE